MNVTPLDFEKPILELEKKLDDFKRHLHGQEIDLDPEVRRIAAHLDKTKQQVYANLSSWDRVKIARHPQRPYALDYLRLCFGEFVELHGDRSLATTARCPAASPPSTASVASSWRTRRAAT